MPGAPRDELRKYEAGLCNHDSLTIWVTDDAIAGWLQDKHGTGKSRVWRKVHIGTAAASDEIVAFDLTEMDMDGAAHVNDLLDQIGLASASIMGDGAYDRPVYMAS